MNQELFGNGLGSATRAGSILVDMHGLRTHGEELFLKEAFFLDLASYYGVFGLPKIYFIRALGQ